MGQNAPPPALPPRALSSSGGNLNSIWDPFSIVGAGWLERACPCTTPQFTQYHPLASTGPHWGAVPPQHATVSQSTQHPLLGATGVGNRDATGSPALLAPRTTQGSQMPGSFLVTVPSSRVASKA